VVVEEVDLQVHKIYPFSDFPPGPDDNFKRGSNSSLKLKNSNESLFRNDAAFDWMYPEHFQLMSHKQWTPVSIACKAAAYLAEPGARVLDIGSGIGKFCLTAAYHYPETSFHGVEQRHELVYFAERARTYTGLSNVSFTHANITQVNFKEFDHFYFYNSFYENLEPENCIDDSIETSFSLYAYYAQYLYNVLDEKPLGTRLVTFHSLDEVIPPGYCLADISYDTLLKTWIKVKI
jgi:hypothetical protein